MKKLFLLLPLCALLFAGEGCKKVNEATEFDISYTTEINVPAANVSTTTPVDFTSPEIPTESASKFDANKTTKDLIDEIILTRLVITSQGGNLDFVKSISVFIKASGLQDLLVASKSNIPSGSKSIAMDPSNANIKEHIFKDRIQFRITVTVNPGMTADQKVKLEETVHVKGKKIK